jgi:hypothetical protein
VQKDTPGIEIEKKSLKLNEIGDGARKGNALRFALIEHVDFKEKK